MEDLLGADEVFLTNSSWHVLPVKGVRLPIRDEDGQPGMDARDIGSGSVGPVTSQLRRHVLDLIDAETRDLPGS